MLPHSSSTSLPELSGFRSEQPVHEGTSRATLPLAEGMAALELPHRLSPESFEDLKDWMAGMLRRAERMAQRSKPAIPANQAADRPAQSGGGITSVEPNKPQSSSGGIVSNCPQLGGGITSTARSHGEEIVGNE